MKKIVLLIACIVSSLGVTSAQDDVCFPFFPNNKGAQLVNKGYDANKNLLTTTTYTVTDAYDYLSGTDIKIDFSISDAKGNMIDKGLLDARCDGGSFFLKLVSKSTSPDIMEILSGDTELVGDYLDYPNTFNNDYPFNGNFKMDEGEFMIQSKADKKDFVKVYIRNRVYEKNEKITTPAGTFDASKITFNFETYNSKTKKTTKFKGVEWYALGAGIVRSETYDTNKKLLKYTELTSMTDK